MNLILAGLLIATNLSSEKASYEGGSLILEGSVEIQTPLRGEELYADRATLNLESRHLTMDRVNGSLLFHDLPFTFSANNFSWNNADGLVKLTEAITLACPSFGTVETEGEIKIDRNALTITITGTEDKHLRYLDDGLTLTSETATLDYRLEEGKLLPGGFQFSGNVLLKEAGKELELSADKLLISIGSDGKFDRVSGLGPVQITHGRAIE